MPFELIENTWFYKFYPFKYVFETYRYGYGQVERSADLKVIYEREKGSYTESKYVWIRPWESYVRYFRWIFNPMSSDSRNPFNAKFIVYMSQEDQNRLGRDLEYFMSDLNFNDKIVQDEIEKHGLEFTKADDPATRYVSEQCFNSIKYMIDHYQNYFSSYPLPGYERPYKHASKFKSLNNPDMFRFEKNIKLAHLVEEDEIVPYQFIKKVYPSDIWRKEKHYYYEPVIRKVWKYRFD